MQNWKKKSYVWNILLELRIAETYINRFKDVSNPETKFKRYKKKRQHIKIVVVCHFRWLPELTDNNLNLQLLKSSFLHFFFQIRLSFCVSEKLQTRKRKLDMNDERLWKLKLIKCTRTALFSITYLESFVLFNWAIYKREKRALFVIV